MLRVDFWVTGAALYFCLFAFYLCLAATEGLSGQHCCGPTALGAAEGSGEPGRRSHRRKAEDHEKALDNRLPRF